MRNIIQSERLYASPKERETRWTLGEKHNTSMISISEELSVKWRVRAGLCEGMLESIVTGCYDGTVPTSVVMKYQHNNYQLPKGVRNKPATSTYSVQKN